MGIFADLQSTSQYPGKPDGVGLDRSSTQQLIAAVSYGDPDLKAAYAARDEVATVPEQTDAGVADTYTLTLTPYGRLAGEAAVTTAAIAFDAVDTVIESAIDAAMASFPGWTNADVSVAMVGAAGLDDGDISLTFDGTSVNEAPWVVTIVATGFTETLPVVRTTSGQGDRKALQALFELNVIAGSVHESPDSPSWTTPDGLGRRPRTQLIGDLARITIEEDGTDNAYDAIKALYPGI